MEPLTVRVALCLMLAAGLQSCFGMHTGFVFERGDMYYKFVPQRYDNRTFQEAKEICREQEDASLLTIADLDEMKWVGKKLKYINYRIKDMGKMWLGAIDKRISLIYEYIDGTPFKYKDVPWLPNEPNRNHRLPYYHCLYMTTDDNNNMAWGDDDCYMANGYICKGIGIPTRLSDYERAGYEFETPIHRYKFFPLPSDSLSWPEAKLYCEEGETGNLLTITDQNENYYITSVMTRLHRYIGFKKVWIGANNYGRLVGNFSWSKPSQPFNFTRWKDNTSLSVRERRGDCVAATSGDRDWGQWAPEDCMMNLPFICKIRRCLGYTDLTFIVDRSGRISEHGFKRIKKFIWQTVRLFPFKYGETKVSMVTYANIPTGHFDFNTYTTLGQIREGIDKAIYTSGAPKLHKALKFTRLGLFTKKGIFREGVARIVVLITGGWDTTNSYETNLIKTEIIELQRYGVHRVVIGAGKNVKKKDLRDLASSPRDVIVTRSERNIGRSVPSMRNLLCDRSMEIQTLGLRHRKRN